MDPTWQSSLHRRLGDYGGLQSNVRADINTNEVEITSKRRVTAHGDHLLKAIRRLSARHCRSRRVA